MKFFQSVRGSEFENGFSVDVQQVENRRHPQRTVAVGSRFMNLRYPAMPNADGRIMEGSFDLSARFPTIIKNGDYGDNIAAVLFTAVGLPMCKLVVNVFDENSEKVQPDVYMADFGEGQGSKFVSTLVSLQPGDEIEVVSQYRGHDHIVATVKWDGDVPTFWQMSAAELGQLRKDRDQDTRQRHQRRTRWQDSKKSN